MPDIANEVRAYKSLARGWDSYSAKTIHPAAIEMAVSIVRMVESIFDRVGDDVKTEGAYELTTAPIADGRVDVECAFWGKRLIVTCDGETGRMGAFMETATGSTEFDDWPEFRIRHFVTEMAP